MKTKFKETEIGKIPEGWEKICIGDAIQINPKRELKRYLQAKKVSMQNLSEFNRKIQNFSIDYFKGGSKFCNGDTLMARITPCLENGKTAFVDILESSEIAFGSTEFIVLCGKECKTLDEFVYYLAISPKMRADAIQSMTGTSGRQRVQTDLLESKKILLPPLSTQKYIAKVLSDLDSKIELNQQMIQTLESMAQALFKHWFIDFEFPDEKGKPYKSSGGKMVWSEELQKEIPEKWKVNKFGNVVDVYGGTTPSTVDASYWNGHINWFTPKEMLCEDRVFFSSSARKISSTGLDAIGGRLVPKHSILLTSRAPVGCVGITNVEAAVNQGIIGAKPKENFSLYFLYNWLIENKVTLLNYSNGSTFQELSKSTFKELDFLCPDKDLLGAFDKVVFPLYEKINQNELELQNLQVLRDSLLPKLMSGKIRVKL